MSYSKADLVSYRVERAKESLNEGKILTAKASWNGAANRFYYACFHIISAYIAEKGIKATTHSGLKATFNKELIKSGKIRKEKGALFNRLFELRQEADYDDFVKMEEEDIKPLIPEIEALINQIESIIKS